MKKCIHILVPGRERTYLVALCTLCQVPYPPLACSGSTAVSMQYQRTSKYYVVVFLFSILMRLPITVLVPHLTCVTIDL